MDDIQKVRTPAQLLEEKLLNAAAGYKGTDGLKEQLFGEAFASGLDDAEASALVEKVLKRLKKTEKSNKKGPAFGIAHDPNKQWNNLVARVRASKY